MRPLTDLCPKPLLRVRGKPLIAYHLEKLARMGVQEVVINLAWLGEQLNEELGDGARWDLRIHYSREPAGALETGGGIFQALPLLGPEPFLVVNGDVFTDLDFAALSIADDALAQLVLVANPAHVPLGDFALVEGYVLEHGSPRWTYSGVGLFRPQLFAGCAAGKFPLRPLLARASAAHRLGGELYRGVWNDVGTVERLAALQQGSA